MSVSERHVACEFISLLDGLLVRFNTEKSHSYNKT